MPAPTASGDETGAITRVLNENAGKDAIDQVFPLVYQELKRIANRLLMRGRADTVTPTVLVHELYAKLDGGAELSVQGRAHFFALCARVMKQIVVDHARAKMAGKRSAAGPRVELSDVDAIDFASPEAILAVEVALQRLAAQDERLAQIIEYRVFGGLELDEIAALYGLTLRHMQREWMRAKIWLTDSLV